MKFSFGCTVTSSIGAGPAPQEMIFQIAREIPVICFTFETEALPRERIQYYYRGNLISPGTQWLYLWNGKWCFASLESGRMIFFSPDQIEGILEEKKGDYAFRPSAPAYYVSRLFMYGSYTNKGRAQFAKDFQDSFNFFYSRNKDVIDAHVKEARKFAYEHGVNLLKQDIAELEEKKAELEKKLAVMEAQCVGL